MPLTVFDVLLLHCLSKPSYEAGVWKQQWYLAVDSADCKGLCAFYPMPGFQIIFTKPLCLIGFPMILVNKNSPLVNENKFRDIELSSV